MSCPIWGTLATPIDNGKRDGVSVDSPRAGGKYFITGTATAMVGNLSKRDKRKLTTWIVDQHRLGNTIPEINSKNVGEIKSYPELRVDQRMFRLLNYIKFVAPKIGQEYRYRGKVTEEMSVQNAHATAWSESEDSSEVDTLLHWLDQEKTIIIHPSGSSLTITAKGHLTLTEISAEEKTQAFIAMWFAEDTEDAYHEGIFPAVSDSGYQPLRIDKKEHNNKIDDEIIAEIRKSRFLIADFTCGTVMSDGTPHAISRGGVYYEAGFAQGMGMPVIWCCREDQIGYVHFDTRQYNHITWRNPGNLRSALRNRIEAVIGVGSGRKS